LHWFSYWVFVKQFDVGKYIELRGNLEVVYLFNFCRAVVQSCGRAVKGILNAGFWIVNYQFIVMQSCGHFSIFPQP
jgi:hypothetical protein